MARDEFPYLSLQEAPRVVAAVIPGDWLLKHTTPSWRIQDPETGFQRQVSEERARAIAIAVLDQGRTFPNAIVLATDYRGPQSMNGALSLPGKIRFLVVDGQHRLWAQKFSEYTAPYCCLVHFGLSEREMAQLFVEINDNQKRVPSSLRWDLVRLVRPDDEPAAVRTSDLVYELATSRKSALHQRIDLTGEQKNISLKQGSVAPAVRSAVAPRGALADDGYDIQLRVLLAYVAAMRECDADSWDAGASPLYGARTFRALFRLLPELLAKLSIPRKDLTSAHFLKFLKRIKFDSLTSERIRAQQGAAGIKAIYQTLRLQVLR